ncbi:hypothetical protein [Pseudobacteriovorax antillogorgiicola]|uniref:Uncharacterized protein n=1 Tax=Pseudobacteriovorax antillogorgiicola TaxID=1513793 RepID=A0A1Y6BQI4_9BACT|nr:hypothetical protein [Pseudobacteriovorax antillogorgiicola]TCS53701.1 hypothetical protein EDD56_10710 [Pseudobacteriovorax antillogorgiicola]SMF23024.1 hypothetical protein SAMN06296036_107262 [Pseudobacteriovorax antillogorgiicola]
MDKAIILIGVLIATNIILVSCLIGKNMEIDNLKETIQQEKLLTDREKLILEKEIVQLEQQSLWEKGVDSKYGIKPGCDGKGNCN